MAIFAVAGGLLLLSIFAFYRTLNLIPTDLGFTWMIGSFVLLGACGIVAAIGLATGRLERAIRSSAVIGPIAEMAGGTPEAPASVEPVMEQMASPSPEPTTGSIGKAAAIGAAGLAAGAAATLAIGAAKADGGSAPTDRTDPTVVDLPELQLGPAPTPDDPFELPPLPKAPPLTADDAFMAELEKDIFADFPALKPTEPVSDIATRIAEDTLIADITARDVPEEEVVSVVVEAIASPTDKASPLEASPAADEDKDILEEPSARPDEVKQAPAIMDPAQELPTVDDSDVVTPPPLPSPPPLPMPGLIQDADLDALTDEAPPLAPLDSLDIVGAYDSAGTRFTMYSDGSVTAVGPTMDRRFVSLEALRAFIDGGAKA